MKTIHVARWWALVGCALFLSSAGNALGFGGTEVAGIEQKAHQGDPEAQSQLGVMYSSGVGQKQDKREAVKWYRNSAEQGYPVAQWNLAFMYVRGEGGLATDFTEARKLFARAADAGLPNAQYDLGVMLLDGLGGKQDQAEANRWFRKAAEQGYRQAEKMLKEFPGN